jgi:hypothetical protein
MIRSALFALQLAAWFVLILLVGSVACTRSFCGDLPANDAGKNQLIVVGQPDAMPAKWFNEVPELAAVKNSVAFTLYPPNSKLFQERYKAILGTDYPIVAYLRPDGGVVYFADRHTLPSNGKALLDEMKAAAFQARNAKPSSKLPQDLDIQQMEGDCVDGNCFPVDSEPNSKPLFPRLRTPRNPLDDSAQVDGLFSGVISNSIGSGLWLVFSGVFLIFIFLGIVLIVGAMIVVSKMW